MRKLFKALIVLTTLAVVSISAAAAFASDDIRVLVDGQEISFTDQRPVIVYGRTLVPIRDVFEAIGFDVSFDEDTATALLSDSDGIFNIAIEIGSPHFSLGVFSPYMPVGHAVIIPLDVPAQIIGGRTMLPLRQVLESVGYELEWDEATQTVLITSASDNEQHNLGGAASSAPIANISHFLGRNMDEVVDLLGSQTYHNPIGKWDTYHFDTGIQIGAQPINGSLIMVSIYVDYTQADNRFHFNQINGSSTYDDVMALFDHEPDHIRNESDVPNDLGAVISYGFFTGTSAYEFVCFSFDADNRVVAINLFNN
ncbi:MAG: copper amine oxidase N-terminal domain-containing protein [Defluviitaleaceae bacterium]|nr:copper amine oxidase N-terminal domain-containing protein [Defluviitaleaceae bacterium]